MGEDFIKETQNSLGKIIKKPPMTSKLLTKPPFRFLHDIITEVIKETGFMKGLYTDSELVSSNVKDKESKIAFLQKAIDLVAAVTGKQLSVRPSKIVAGHEAEKTNELLQAIAKACKSQPDSSDAVQRVLKGEKAGSSKPPRPKKDDDRKRDSSAKKESDKDRKDGKNSSDNRLRGSSKDRDGKRDGSREKDREVEKGREKEGRQKERSKDRSKERSKDREKDRSKDRDKERGKDRDKERSKDRDKERSKDRDKGHSKDRERGKDKERSRDKERSKDRDSAKDRKEREKDRTKERSGNNKEAELVDETGRTGDNEKEEKARKDESAKPAEQNEVHNDDGEEDMRPVNGEVEDGASSNRLPRPSSAKGQRRRPAKDSNNGESDQKPSSKHSREDLVDGEEKPPVASQPRRSARPSSARPAPPRLKKQESTDKDEARVGSGKQVSNVIVDNAHHSDEDESFVVEEAQPIIVDNEPGPMQSESLEDDGDHGGLVKKILETKKELEGTQNEQKEKEKPVLMDAAHRKQRELVQREVEKLRGSIQTLTRSANPLGKIMDYLQEDVDSMQKELETWKKENREQELAIKREQSITDSELEPLQAQLSELDQSMRDQVDAIATVKSNILRNDERIRKMMGSVAFS